MVSEAGDTAVDVLLPVYNGEATIEEAVKSVLEQTVERIRLIVIDDGSSDRTPGILARIRERDRRVTVLTTPNGGIVDALNLGLSQASAPFIARHDGDDRSFRDRFARQLALLEAHPEVVAVSGACLHIDAAGRRTGTRYVPPDPAAADYSSVPSIEPYLLHPFLMLRGKALKDAGGYRYVFNSEDTDLYWRLREAGKLVNMPEPLGEMRLHGQSVSNASVVGGRIMAVSSQLAAVSARRRAEGREDLAFPKERMAAYKAAQGLERILEIAESDLTADERSYLRAAAAAKLLELADGRQYEIETDDCHFIRRVYRSCDPAMFRTHPLMGWAYRAALRRLIRGGRLAEARALLDWRALGRTTAARFGRAQIAEA